VDTAKKPGINSGQCLTSLLIIIALLLSDADLLSQNVLKPSRQSSLEAFSKGDYDLAYSQFSELLNLYPGDPIYKYYSGVCLVKLNSEPERAATLLKQAQQGSAAIRSIPSDVQFWLGRAQQLSGKFSDAIVSYNYFTEMNGKKAARDLGVPEFIQQCERQEGKLSEKVAPAIFKTLEKKPDESKEEKKVIARVEKPEEKPELIDSVSTNYDKLLSEALELQYKADSLYKIADEQKKGLEKGSYAERTKLKTRITETEALAVSFQEQADRKYNIAQEAMNKKPFTAEYIPVPPPADTAITETIPADTLKKEIRTNSARDTLITTRDTIMQSIVSRPPDIQPPVDTVMRTEAKIRKAPATVDLYSVFEVKEKAPDEKIEINSKIPQGLIYRIQVAVFRNPVAYSYFKGIVPVYGFKIAGKDLTVYYAGMFRRLADASKALTVVRKKGFKDAFVASLYGGKAISSEKAVQLEKEWGKKPVITVTVNQVPADTVPPALTFRVEVIRSLKPVKDDVLEGIKKLAGTRGLEIVTLPDKTMVCLIGTFITFESAEEYADLLIRNGYSNAKVGAWLGKKEIPVDTARQLFERLE
jgi:hypothetical protein